MDRKFVLKFILFFILSTAAIVALSLWFCELSLPDLSNIDITVDTQPPKYTTVIIDAGHGGEDGGASSALGLVEKNINLDIATMLCEMLQANGINVIMTRTDDRLLYDRNVDFQGRKKVLDLEARLNIAQSTPDSIFVSIHMNSFTDSRYSGLQVWHSKNNSDSEILAQMIQDNVKNTLQPNNNRRIKAATSSIYLLDKATSPSILIECGFLSNQAEANRFEGQEHRRQITFAIFSSISEFLALNGD